MRVLGIESSCDETAASVVENGRRILSSVVLSQENLHRPFKGIVPEIASRAHLENINSVIEKAVRGQGTAAQNPQSAVVRQPVRRIRGIRNPRLSAESSESIDAIAVTVGPGLVGSLLIGKMTAEALGWVWNCPVVGVNHLEAHLFANQLQEENFAPPFIGLIVSGGHTDLVLVKKWGTYRLLGRTRDDAAGECFDKVAKIFGLGYPGGPEIDRLSKKGLPSAYRFPRPYLKGSWDFSFSGLKTSALYLVQSGKLNLTNVKPGNQQSTPNPQLPTLNSKLIPNLCASFQAAVVDVLVEKTLSAASETGVRKVVVGGGVAANSELRARFLSECAKRNIRVYLPTRELCTDNAAMVASAGYYKLKSAGRDFFFKKRLEVDASLMIENWKRIRAQ